MSKPISDDIEQQRARIALLREELKCAEELLRRTRMCGPSRILSIRVSETLYQEIVNRAGAARQMSSVIRDALEHAFRRPDINQQGKVAGEECSAGSLSHPLHNE